MKEYISKDRAKQFVCGHCNEVCSEELCEPSDCDWMAFIDKEPAANVVEARHGRRTERMNNALLSSKNRRWCTPQDFFDARRSRRYDEAYFRRVGHRRGRSF